MSSHHTVRYGKKIDNKKPAYTIIDTNTKGLTLIIAQEGQGHDSIPKIIASSLARNNPDNYYAYHVPYEWNNFLETIGSYNLIPNLMPVESNSFGEIDTFSDDINILFVSFGKSTYLYNRQDIDQIVDIVTKNSTHVILTVTPEVFVKHFVVFKDLIQTAIISSLNLTPEILSIFNLEPIDTNHTPYAGEVLILSDELMNVKLDVPPFTVEEL